VSLWYVQYQPTIKPIAIHEKESQSPSCNFWYSKNRPQRIPNRLTFQTSFWRKKGTRIRRKNGASSVFRLWPLVWLIKDTLGLSASDRRPWLRLIGGKERIDDATYKLVTNLTSTKPGGSGFRTRLHQAFFWWSCFKCPLFHYYDRDHLKIVTRRRVISYGPFIVTNYEDIDWT